MTLTREPTVEQVAAATVFVGEQGHSAASLPPEEPKP